MCRRTMSDTETAANVPTDVLTRADEEPIQTWSTEHELYELYSNDEIGTVVVEYYNDLDGWSHVETRSDHITQALRD